MAVKKSDFGDINIIDCNKIKVKLPILCGDYHGIIFPKSIHGTVTLSLGRKTKQGHKKKKKQLFMQRSVNLDHMTSR